MSILKNEYKNYKKDHVCVYVMDKEFVWMCKFCGKKWDRQEKSEDKIIKVDK